MKNRLGALVLLAVGLLTACGKDYCIAGFGNCAGIVQNAGNPTTPVLKKLELTSTAVRMVPNSAMTLTVKGGVEPYQLGIVSGGGYFSDSTKTTAVYHSPNYTGTVLFKVTDAENHTSSLSITIE